MPPAERRALLFLLVLALIGHGVMTWLHRPDGHRPPGDVRILGPASAEDLAAHRDSSAAADRPLGEGEKIDLDKAAAVQLARLPKVGPGMAKRIAEYRAAHGPFGSLDGLNQVPGIGEGVIEAIRGHAEFSAAGRIVSAAPFPSIPVERRGSSPSYPSFTPDQPQGSGSAASDRRMVDLNSASETELERLPFVGPSLARRIVEYRAKHGAFPSIDSLVRVAGVGPGTMGRIRDLVVVR